jgi:hypothetical protein
LGKTGLTEQVVNGRNEECHGFAGTSLGLSHDIVTRDRSRNSRCLDLVD